jgi:hypothetical protein
MATLAELRERVQSELDLEDEDFISDAELNGYIRRGVRSAENIILNLYEDYFLAKPFAITLVDGQSEYTLPSGIYAQKIRKLIYNGDNEYDRYLVKKIKRLEETAALYSGDDFMYVLTNDATNGVRITLYPTPGSADAGKQMLLWHIRKAKDLQLDTDIIDIPEALEYINQYAKDQCINKERMTPDAPKSAALAEEERLLIEGLTERIPDDDNTIEPDLSYYSEVN